ncbi:MAG: CAP domain-containing protein [Sphingomonadales bacterium]|nr:CAP domain-containing protein [Sphingomonadales bacterium]
MTMRAALSLFAAAGLLAGCSVVPEAREQPAPDPTIAEDQGELRPAMIEVHNAARRAVGVPALTWDAGLARDARIYAEELARDERFDHSPSSTREGQGENLWMGTRGAYTFAEMAGGWVDERRHFRRGRFPDNSTSGDWLDVGHYTQIVWRTTQRVGCGVASNARDDYLVCRYAPQGNIVGRDPIEG